MAIRDLEEDGDGYFASVSDLMVGILFVFLLMMTVYALNYRRAEQNQEVSRKELETAQKEADRFRRLLENALRQLRRDLEASSSARDRLLTTLERDLNARGIKVTVDRQAGVLHLPGDLLFGTLSATLGPKQRESVDVLADALAKTLPCFTPIHDQTARCETADLPILESVLVEGHTDRRLINGTGSPFRDNDQLSTERALTVFAELQRVQPQLDMLLNADRSYPLLGFSGFGARRPLPGALGDTEADYAQNRRIDLRFLLARTAELERLRAQIEAVLKDSER
jgi:chemotaxis protein MotB